MELKKRITENPEYENDVLLRINNLSVWTPEEKSWWRNTVKPKNIILNNVIGCIREGEFAAVIGPSGAGKTTLLVSLAGRCRLPSLGNVSLVCRERLIDVRGVPLGLVEVVPQFEVFMESLTVMEHLIFMTEMKLGSSALPTNRILLHTLLAGLQLSSHVQTPLSALSGGQKRLLSLAASLLSNPKILICDEPTTGLDSYNASLVVTTLKKLSLSGTAVLCSVHQPSSDLFREFNTIMLMAEGKLLFHGSQEDCRNVFHSIGLRCPTHYNPAEFYVRAVSCAASAGDNIQTISSIYHARYRYHDNTTSEASNIEIQNSNVSRRHWLRQVHLLIWRSSIAAKRNLRSHFIQLFICIMISSLVLGTCYVGVTGTTQEGIQNIRGFLWLLCSEVSFNLAYNALYVFAADAALFRREVGIYGTSAYFVAAFLSLLPRCIIWPAVYIAAATATVPLPNHSVTALELTVVLVVTSVASAAYGLGMGALFTSSGAMGDIMPCVDLPLFLMSGAFLRISSLPMWLLPIKYVSHFYYTMDAISNIYWRQIDNIDCPSNSTSTCVTNGIGVLIENGYSNDFITEDSLGLIAVTVIWSLLGYYGLKREEKKGYAY